MNLERMLIANRGEIAVRIIRACQEMGIATVLAHSEADRDSLAARLADQTVCIGPPQSDKSYLNIPNVVSAALIKGCDSLHPGYGFLSENAYLAEACAHCDLVFVGPPAQVISAFSNKVEARRNMARAGLPVVPGSDDAVPNLEAARAVAASIGFPVMLKAAAGGGGRGMRTASNDEELVRAYPLAQAEAQAAFGNGDIYVERLLLRARHVEVQVAADRYGNVIHLGERDCSIQRRHQKLVEEAPCLALDPTGRAAVCEAAVQGATFAKYESVGTVEFLLAPTGEFYFLEMNTRIQVEHPVTEMVTGIDLLKLQILIAAGEPLPYAQHQVKTRGHAIECRLVAEDPERDFTPEYAPISNLHWPGGPGVRVDTHVFAGYAPPPYYDSLLAKLVTWGSDRADATARMTRALRETRIEGPGTNAQFLLRVLQDAHFQRGEAHTQWAPGR